MPTPGRLRLLFRASASAASRARRSRIRGLLLAAIACASWPLASFAADDGPDQLDVSGYPKEQQERYKIFAVRCSKCHSLARPLKSRIRGTGWKPYIKKMARRPGSGINEESGEQIYKFLQFYSAKLEAEKKDR